jgi:hypothetical protein
MGTADIESEATQNGQMDFPIIIASARKLFIEMQLQLSSHGAASPTASDNTRCRAVKCEKLRLRTEMRSVANLL